METQSLTRVPDPTGIFKDPKGTIVGIAALGMAGGVAWGAVRLGNATLGDLVRNGVPNAIQGVQAAAQDAQEQGNSSDFPFY